jgi:hypothetical protein
MSQFDMIYLLTAIVLPPGSSSTVKCTHKQYSTHLHTNNTQNDTKKQYIEQHENFGRVRYFPCLCEVYPGVYLTTEEKARKNIRQGSRRMPVGTMKTEYTEQSVHNNKNT